MIEVELPDGSVAEFPDGTPPEAMKSAIAKRFPPQRQQHSAPAFDPGVEGYNPETGMVDKPTSRWDQAGAFLAGAQDIPIAGPLVKNAVAGAAAGLVSPFSDQSFGDIQSQMRGTQERVMQENPGSALAGQLVGTTAALAPLGATGIGAKALGLSGSLPARIGMSAASGAGISGADTAVRGGDMGDIGMSAALGGGIGGAIPGVSAALKKGVQKVISPFATSPERTGMAKVLEGEGVELTAGQKTGSKGLRYAESEIGGGKAEGIAERQGEQFTAAALKRAGITANRATPEVIDNAFSRIGQQFDDLAARNELVPDQKFVADLRAAFNEYGELVPESMRSPVVQGVVNDIAKAIKGNRKLSGEAYQSLRSRLDRAARSSKADPQLSEALRGIRNALDEGMERSLYQAKSPDVGAWRKARKEYRNMIVLEKSATAAGEDARLGLIGPSALRNATVTGHGRRAFARGKGDFAELARAGEAVMKPLPQSGTAPRQAARNLGMAAAPAIVGAGAGGAYGGSDGGGLTGAITGALTGFLAPRAVGRAMMSKAGQKYLANQLIKSGPMTPQKQELVKALLTMAQGANLAISGQ